MTIERPAVFLDRDGTLNEMVYDATHGVVDSPFWPERLILKRHAAAFVAALNRLGYLCFVVTNQPGLAKGTLTLERLDRIHAKLRQDLAREGATLDDVLFCPHHPDPAFRDSPYGRECDCRKPAAGMILTAAARHRIDLRRSFTVGDGLTDVEAGRRAGTRTILVGKLETALMERIAAQPDVRPDRCAPDLAAALRLITTEREGQLGAAREAEA